MGFFGDIGRGLGAPLGFGADPRAGYLKDALSQYQPQIQGALGSLQQQAVGGNPVIEAQRKEALQGALAAGGSLQSGAAPGQQGNAARQAAQGTAKAQAGINSSANEATLQSQRQAQQMLMQWLMQAQGQGLKGAGMMAQMPTQGERMLGGLSALGGWGFGRGNAKGEGRGVFW